MTDDERSKRRRGKRGGRGRGGNGGGNEIPPEQQQPEVPAPSESIDSPTGETSQETPSVSSGQATGSGRRERSKPSASGGADVSPMDFWRSGRPRTHRDRPVQGGKGPTGVVNRVRHMYFPPWVPVAGIIFVVFGILGLLFVTRSATGAPRIGEDHWHATYTFYACGDKQPSSPTWEGVGVHTHGDGVVHIHPFTSSEEGAGARLVKWFGYGSGKLDSDEIRLPGLSKTWKNGEVCPETSPDAGQEGVVQVFVNSVKLDDWSRYIPKDGDRIQLIFGPEEDFVQLPDRIVLNETADIRTIEITITGDPQNEAATAFDPASIQVKAGELVKVVVTNTDAVSHGVRFAGGDAIYDTGDDFVVVPEGSDPATADQGDVIEPGASGFAVIRFDDPGTVEFKDPTATNPVTNEPFASGTVIVGESASATPSASDEADQSVDVIMRDGEFDPEEITLEADKSFQLNLSNEGGFAHNLRIDGPDGEFETADDISSVDVDPGAAEVLKVLEPLEAGTYRIRDDFSPTTMTGTLVVE